MNAAAPRDSKTRLLDAALTVVRTVGYAAATVEDICTAAGVSKGSFFHHFRTKDDLALAAIAQWERLTEALFTTAGYHRLADPLDRVLGYVALRGELLGGEVPDFTCFLGTLVQETHHTHPTLRLACERTLDRHVQALAQDLEAAKARYAPAAEWRAESVSVYIQSVLQGAFIFAKAQQSAAVVRQDLEHLTRHLHSLFNRHHEPPEDPAMTNPDSGIQRYQTYINAAPEQVWDALTRPEHSVLYGYSRVEYRGQAGGSYKAYPTIALQGVMPVDEALCDGEILEWRPPHRLVQTFRMLMDPTLAAEGFTHLSYEIEAARGGVSKLTVTHDVSEAPLLASVVAGGLEEQGGGGGWLEIVSGLKTLLETGVSLPSQA